MLNEQMTRTAGMVGKITSTEPMHALNAVSDYLFTDSSKSLVYRCSPGLHYNEIEIPGLSAKDHSSAQVEHDLYLISFAELAVKKVENLLNDLHNVKVTNLGTLGQ